MNRFLSLGLFPVDDDDEGLLRFRVSPCCTVIDDFEDHRPLRARGITMGLPRCHRGSRTNSHTIQHHLLNALLLAHRTKNS